MCPFPEHQRFRVIRMSRDQVIDMMTFNSCSLQCYSFYSGKIGFGCLKHEDWFLFFGATPIHTGRYSVTVDSLWKDTEEHGSC